MIAFYDRATLVFVKRQRDDIRLRGHGREQSTVGNDEQFYETAWNSHIPPRHRVLKLSALPPAENGGRQRHMSSGGRSGRYVSDLKDEAKKIDEATELIELGVLQLRSRLTTATVGNTRLGKVYIWGVQ